MQDLIKELWETKGTLKPEGWEIRNGNAHRRIDCGMVGHKGDVEIRTIMTYPSSTGVSFSCDFKSTDGNSYAIAIKPQPDNIVDAMVAVDLQLIEEGIA